MKIKVFTDHDAAHLENSVNEFLIAHESTKEIKFITSLRAMDDLVPGNDVHLFYSVLVVYKE
ncbi:hypothetical protein M3N64_13075 [Sporolactobacillus sp. CPB3-1]|uniref:Sporulation protein Cse60 n=1 Tax=Sporolactobacillus mangiferae TaxID=2940498 RepID=A0ABT0MDB1_9BACL|nr:hypothetical protein [Sporolactobacillus mangiferae]MCL1632853.1 hypothetical protein [Sporolactobacillus mangiferae]